RLARNDTLGWAESQDRSRSLGPVGWFPVPAKIYVVGCRVRCLARPGSKEPTALDPTRGAKGQRRINAVGTPWPHPADKYLQNDERSIWRSAAYSHSYSHSGWTACGSMGRNLTVTGWVGTQVAAHGARRKLVDGATVAGHVRAPSPVPSENHI